MQGLVKNTTGEPQELLEVFGSKNPIVKDLAYRMGESNPILGLSFAILTRVIKPIVGDTFHYLTQLPPFQLGQLFTSQLIESINLMEFYFQQISFETQDFITTLRQIFSRMACQNDPLVLDTLVQGLSKCIIGRFINRPFLSEAALHMFTFALLILDIDINERRSLTRGNEESVRNFQSNIQGTNEGQDYDLKFISQVIESVKQNRIVKVHKPQPPNLDPLRARLSSLFSVVRLIKYSDTLNELWEMYYVDRYYILIKDCKIKVLLTETVRLFIEGSKHIFFSPKQNTVCLAVNKDFNGFQIKTKPQLRFIFANPNDAKRFEKFV